MKRLYSIERGNNWQALGVRPEIAFSTPFRRFTSGRVIRLFVQMDQLWGRG